MEAVPKLPLISFELKTSPENTHFGPKLKQYIGEAYREDPDSYSNEIHTLEGLRSAAVRSTSDSAGLNAMTRYFCQLRAMQSRFPMAKGQPVACTFVWKDLYANMSCSMADIRFEMACVLYNIGALHTELGASEPRTSPESLKAACTHYQHAAWAFMYLREHYPQPPGVDVSTDIMRFMQEVCFAQAQECILDKSIQDTKKPSVVGAVATQVLFFYRNSLALLGPSTGTDNIHEVIGTKLYNYWHHYLSFKLAYIGCIVNLYQGLNAEEQQKMGERVAFYQQSLDKLGEARKLAKYIEPIQITLEALSFTNDVVEGKRKAAKNENEFIYHEEVPDKDLLIDLKPVCLVKALPINFNDPDVSGPDVFSRLVPMGAHEASSIYSEEKAKLLRQVVSQAESKNTEILEFMSSLQLDQLEVLDSDQKIPQEIVDRCAAMNAKEEIIQMLVDSMNNLAEIISDVEHSLVEIKTMIQEETQKEKDYQKVMGPRPPSIVQTELSREFHKYQEAHTRTNESNQVLHKAMTLHIANLRLLAQPLEVLQSKIPSIDNIEGLDRGTMTEMRVVVGKAREMQAQRELLVQQLRAAVTADDITAQLLARSDPADVIFKQELEKHTPQVKIIEQNLAAQENIINKLTSLYAKYGDSRRLLSDVLRKREGLINALVTSYDTYEELLGKSQKGLEFYKKLSLNVNQLLSRLRSTCQVQEEERAQHLSKQTRKAPPTPVPTTSAAVKQAESPVLATTPPPSSSGGPLKLKDYLPYMKNRGLSSRNVPPQAQPEALSSDAYYPESIYPTSVRPAPVGSEDISQMKLTDGVAGPPMPSEHNPYSRYGPYAHETDPYSGSTSHNYPATSKAYDKPEDGPNYSYNAYAPPHFPIPNPESPYAHPYYPNSNPLNTDSQVSYGSNINHTTTSMSGQHHYDSYTPNAQIGAIPETYSTYSVSNQITPNDLNATMAQMQVSTSKTEPTNYGQDYQSNYYSQYPQTSSQYPPSSGQFPPTSVPNIPIQGYGPSSITTTPSHLPMDYGANQYTYNDNTGSQNGPGSTIPNMSSYAPANQSGLNPAQPHYSNPGQANPAQMSYNLPDQHYGGPPLNYDNLSQGYTIYTNNESIIASTTSVEPSSTPSMPLPYSSIPTEHDPKLSAAFAQLDAMDQPIKSHVTGEALSTGLHYQSNYQNYDQNVINYSTTDNSALPNLSNSMPNYGGPTDPYQAANQQYSTTNAQSHTTNINYVQTPQNHPGYAFNSATGNYDYSYGSQNATSYIGQANVEPNAVPQDSNWAPNNLYTSAGMCETVQSPSETPQAMPMNTEQVKNDQYYNVPYGYITTTNQSNEVVTTNVPVSTNYGANVNQSTYMQSGQQNTSVTYSNNQVSTIKENVIAPQDVDQNSGPANVISNNEPVVENTPEPQEIKPQVVSETKPVETKQPEPAVEMSAFDLLSDIDFSVEQKPLMPEIKVPQISESAIKKHVVLPKIEPIVKPVVKEDVIERPAKMDLFSDPSMLNKFTQEVKNLQKLTDSLTEKAPGGLTVLDAKWKNFQDVQNKENMSRSKSIARQHTGGNILTEVVPFDDSRLTLKTNPDAYINASYYKQLAPWCIPLVISKTPSENEHGTFWQSVLENKLGSIVCLLSEIEMQGKTYWPTAIGQTLDVASDLKVTLTDVTCTVYWTERRLAIISGKTLHNISHYQINVFPAKIVCSPLVLLADKVLSQTYDNRLSNQLTGAWIHCAAGAGRSAVVALLIMAMCQVRAGQINLCDMLDIGCINLYKHRTNVLEDTKYLADTYRTVLFYGQGVLCSGTTMFNGEAVSVPSGAAILPPVTPTAPTASNNQKIQKFSRESFEEMKQSPGLKSGDMKDPLNFLDPLWSLKKK